MPPEKRVTIAQISDLHINRKVKQPMKDMLKRVLQKIDPDVLIVSGDLANQPVWWQMKKAAKLVTEIQKGCAPERGTRKRQSPRYIKRWRNTLKG